MKIINKFLFTCLTLLVFFILPVRIIAQENNTDIYTKLVNSLNLELNNVYVPYTNFFNKISVENYEISNSDIYEFKNLNNGWNKVFFESKSVYGQYITNPDPHISEIAVLAQEGSNKGILATEYYKTALESDNNDIYSSYLDRGDEMMVGAVESHDKAVDLYNNYSGATSNQLSKNGLITGSILASVLSIILLFKSRKKSDSDTEKLRSEIYKNLFVSSLWFTGGLIVTTIGFVDVYENGGTYTIFWGAIVVGGWQLLRGLYEYFTNSRQVLSDISTIEKNKVLRELFNESKEGEEIIKNSQLIKCRYCGSKQPSNRIICNKCGENML